MYYKKKIYKYMEMKFKNGNSIESVPYKKTKRSVRGRRLNDKETKLMLELEIINAEKE